MACCTSGTPASMADPGRTAAGRVSFFRDSAAFPSNSSPFIGRQQYTTDGQSAIWPEGCAQASRVIAHTRLLPLFGAFDEAGPQWVEVNVFRFLVIFLNASRSAVDKSRLPKKAPLSSARVDAKRRAHLDRFHYTRDGDRETGEYDRRPRRGGSSSKSPSATQPTFRQWSSTLMPSWPSAVVFAQQSSCLSGDASSGRYVLFRGAGIGPTDQIAPSISEIHEHHRHFDLKQGLTAAGRKALIT